MKSVRHVSRSLITNQKKNSSIALSFRRPSALRYGPWVARCIQYLEETPDAHVNDQRLASWVRLQILAEESLAVVGLDEGARLDFNDPRTRFILKECIEKVVHWRNSLAENVMNGIAFFVRKLQVSRLYANVPNSPHGDPLPYDLVEPSRA